MFAAAGLKQVFGYEERAETKFTGEFFKLKIKEWRVEGLKNCEKHSGWPKLLTLFGQVNVKISRHVFIFGLVLPF